MAEATQPLSAAAGQMPFDLEAWDAWSPEQLYSRLQGTGVKWAVAGGWALELFTGTARRPHDDLEIVIASDSFEAIRAGLPELVWFVAADGNVARLVDAQTQLNQTWQTWGWDAAIERWRVDVMREPWTEHDWVYRRRPAIRVALERAIATSPAGVPYLAPELVLLFKARHCRDKDTLDFDAALPLLRKDQRSWLVAALHIDQPTHPWLARL
jgi:hypothetical protein